MKVELIGPEAEAQLDWLSLCAAFEAGHALPRAEIADTFLYRRADTLLNRAAWIDGLGQLVKCATVFPGNGALGKPTINGAVTLYGDQTGELEALVDFHLVTKWKTAGDSLLSARKLARPDSREILLVGAGKVAASCALNWPSLLVSARSNAAAAAVVALPPGPTVKPEPDWVVPLLWGPNCGGDEDAAVCACNAPMPPRERAAKSITLRVSNE